MRLAVGEPLNDRRFRGFQQLYVCPRTGLLRRVVPRRVPEPPRPPTHRRVTLTASQQCHFLDNAWHLVTVEPFPETAPIMRDTVLRRDLTRGQAIQFYGAAVYGIHRRLLGKREMRQLPIPIA